MSSKPSEARHGRLFWSALVGVAVLGLLPLGLVVREAGTDGDAWIETVTSDLAYDAFLETLQLATATTLFALLIGAPVAWLVTRSDLPWKGALRALLTIPYIVPPYIAAVAWINLANPQVGLLNNVFGEGALDIYSFGGLTWVLSLSFFPYVFLTVRSALENADPALEDAARMSGAGTWGVFRHISLPLMLPSMLASAGLVFMATASAFGAPALLGAAAGIDVLSTRIYESLTSGLGGTAQACSLATMLFAFALLPMILPSSRVAVMGGKASRPSLLPLGAARIPALTLLLLFVTVATVLPALAVTVTAFLRIAGDFSADNFTVDNFDVLARADCREALVNSLWLGAAAATIAVVLGGLVAFIEVKTQRRGRKLLSAFTSAPLATPGTVLAIGLILAWTRPIKLTNTVWILLIAYVVRFMALAARAIAEGLGTVDNALPEAARMSGAKGLFLMRTIWIPMILPSLAAGWFLVFMPAFSELTMSVILVGPGVDTIGTRMFELQEYEGPTAASVLATVVLAIIITINVTLRLVTKGRYGI